MSTNTGLIARLREGQTYDFNTGLLNDMSCPMDDAADAIEALGAEVRRLTVERDVNKRMRDQHFAEVERLKGLYESSTAAHEETVGRAMRAEAQLAAAQGQVEEQPIKALQKLGARLAALLDEDQWAECEALLIEAGARQ